jgi:preprotein translocase subunit YajC
MRFELIADVLYNCSVLHDSVVILIIGILSFLLIRQLNKEVKKRYLYSKSLKSNILILKHI